MLRISILLLGATHILRAVVPGDEHWDTQFGWPGPGGNNYAIASHHGRLYVGGLGTTTNTPLMVWDGAQWSAMSQFYGSSGTVLFDLAFVDENLYAAGSFTNVDGVAANGLARWNGTNWSSLGFKGTAYSLAVDGTDLYVAGSFSTNLAGLALTNVAKWDGSNWSALGKGLGSTNLSLAYCVAASNGTVYAGGVFTNSGNVLVTNIARWNGTSWSPLGAGLSNIVFCLTLKGSDLYCGGLFGSPPSATGVAQWNGVTWSYLGAGFNDRVQSLAVLGNDVCAAGNFTNVGVLASHFAMWNGTSWSPAGSGLSANANRAISTGSNIYVGGNFSLAGGVEANGLASWDGGNWSRIGIPGRLNGLSSQVNALAGDGTNLYAGGLFTSAGGTNANYIARFDGTNWHPLGSGIGPVGGITAINAIVDSNRDVYVAGSFTTAGSNLAVNIAHWNGTNWNSMGFLPGMVYALLLRPEGLYAAGTGYSSGTYGAGFCYRYNAASNTWVNAFTIDANDTFFAQPTSDTVGMDAMASLGTDLYIGGRFSITWHDPTLTYFTNCNNILRFDGTSARIVGTGLNSNVVAMTVFNNNLYVSGPFTNAGGITASGIARWDGAQWSSVGGGIVGRGTISTMTAMGGNLYVGGSFTNLGGTPVARIAKWDGVSWSGLGSGVSATLLALYNHHDTDLYAGGAVRIAGSKPSMFVARWNEQTNFHIPQLANPRWSVAGQFQARIYGVAGVTNTIEATTNFSTWTPILTNSTGVYDFTDPGSASLPRQFYRARLGP